jgi:transposase-like protein
MRYSSRMALTFILKGFLRASGVPRNTEGFCRSHFHRCTQTRPSETPGPLRIAGQRMYLWRTVDHEGGVLDLLVQRRRDTRAALRLMRKLLKKQRFVPKLPVTDKLRSYASAFRRLRLTCPHEQGLRKNNRVENSH